MSTPHLFICYVIRDGRWPPYLLPLLLSWDVDSIASICHQTLRRTFLYVCPSLSVGQTFEVLPPGIELLNLTKWYQIVFPECLPRCIVPWQCMSISVSLHSYQYFISFSFLALKSLMGVKGSHSVICTSEFGHFLTEHFGYPWLCLFFWGSHLSYFKGISLIQR